MKKFSLKKLILFLVILFVLILLLIFGVFCFKLSPVSNDDSVFSYDVELGKSVYEVFNDLESKGYIRSAFALKVYSKIFNNDGIDAGSFTISKSYSATKIYEILSTDNISHAAEVEFLIKEGDTIDDIIATISDLSNKSKDEVKAVFNDSKYLNELIDAYWFLTDDVLNEDIYYSLEGYLYPDLYRVYKDADVKDYIEKALENTKNKLDSVKNDIDKSGKSVHEILTMASILQLEGSYLDDMKVIAGIFNNRINDGMGLGSDVTTYYANHVKIGSRDLTVEEIDSCNNKYNTRCSSNLGLPVGPICAFNMSAIKASLNPENNSYYYFVTDKEGNLYSSKTYTEHVNTINRLKNEGLWYEFE